MALPADKALSPKLTLTLTAALLACGLLCATGLGFIPVTAGGVIRITAANLLNWDQIAAHVDKLHMHVVWDVRLPRILTSAAVGAGLAMSGVVFQGMLMNPLADPFTLGVSSGAAFGASLCLLAGLTFLGPYTVCFCAFAGAAATLLAVIRMSSIDGRMSPTNLILAGVIVAAILSAGISLMKYLADEEVAVIVFWLMGSLVSRTWLDFIITFTATMGGAAVFFLYARDLNLMCLGNRSASSLGVDVRKVRIILLITASLVSAACVSVSGIIGFVGLLVPHLMRLLVGPDSRVLLPASGLAGGLLLLGADTVSRAVLPHEVPIGVLTAIIGGPFFCYVFRRRQMEAKRV